MRLQGIVKVLVKRMLKPYTISYCVIPDHLQFQQAGQQSAGQMLAQHQCTVRSCSEAFVLLILY